MKFNLRNKLLFFSAMIAILPLIVAGYFMISITQDELKSAANDELSTTADQLAKEIDNSYTDSWVAPLVLIKNALESDQLGLEETVSLITGTKNLTDIIAMQITVEGANPALITQDEISARLSEKNLSASDILLLETDKIRELLDGKDFFSGDLIYQKEADLWMLKIIFKLKKKLFGRETYFSAIINLDRIKQRFLEHPFTKTGEITLIDKNGSKLFDPQRKVLTDYKVVSSALSFLKTGTRAIGVEPYTRPDGTAILGAFSFPLNLDFAVISERRESDAYLAVTKMFQSLLIWVTLGLGLASFGAIILALTITRPIIKIGEVVQEVGKGIFSLRVPPIKSKDEVSELGLRINAMIEGLRERFELQKFVSGQTINAIKEQTEGIKLGGERKTATVFFSDIRGFTAFSEKVQPEKVIEMLNTFLKAQAEIVKKYNGDIDKFVGDELVAVFQGKRMVENAVLASVEIHEKIKELNALRSEGSIAIGIGINTGEMVMGAMGSEERMDYTILGDNVNLGARLCSAASPYQTILSEKSFEYIKDTGWIHTQKLEPLKVKGKEKPITIYEVTGIDFNSKPQNLTMA
ncbi:MAG: HAMP domain-containing protein [Ignavibacteriales bacterium]|nr:HAMP domain-containing protein [Ignavibacteriaceae bacterium]QOJ29010.1 MAG: HAMP domain-containing protein [Ignavibacteriales bacterium]